MLDSQRLVQLIKITTPIMNGNAFQIKTAQTEACCAQIVTWLQVGIMGGFILGPTRHGKTSAVRWALKALKSMLNIPLSVFEIPVRSQKDARERDFFEYLLRAVGHRNWKSGTAGNKRDRLNDFLTARARSSPIKTVVLYFDEAQFLKDHHWEWLLNLSNESVERNIKIFFLFSGPPELAEARERYVSAGLTQLVGRFMSVVFELNGLTSQGQLRDCLQRFSDVVYPKAQGLGLASHFVDPAKYPGFSLASYAPSMWNLFHQTRAKEAYPQEDAPSTFVLPMHYVTAAILHFLTGLATNQDPKVSVEDLLSSAVAACGFSDFTRSTNLDPKRQARAYAPAE